MYKGKNIAKEIANMKYIYQLIVNEGKEEYKDEYICSFQIVRNYSIQKIPNKYIELYRRLEGIK
jgi:hypothetical protein